MEKAKLRILLISFVFSPNIGGVESHLDDLCEYLTKKGHKLSVITYQPLLSSVNAPSVEKRNNLEIRRIPWLKFNLFNRLEKIPILEFLYLTPSILIYTFFYLLRNRKKIDVIQTHGFNMAIVGAIISIIFRKRFTVNTHVSFSFIKNSIYAKILCWVLNRASKVLVLTKEAKSQLVKIGVNKEKIIVYHQWIDNNLFKPKDKAESRKKTGLDVNKFIVLFTGRFIRPKGINFLLEAASRVKNNIQFVFVGSGPLKESIAKASRDNSRIHFVGEVKRLDLPYYFSSADVSIIPSIQGTKTYSEGIPRVMIEAFSCGKPVIATKAGGVKEFIDGDVGFFISPKSSSIASLVNSLSNKKDKLEKMGLKCIDIAKKEFSLNQNAEIIEKSLL